MTNERHTGLDEGPPIPRKSRLVTFVPARIKGFRLAAKLTQEQAARCLGLSRTNFIALEQGKRKMTGDEWNTLATAYGLSEEARQEAITVTTKKIYLASSWRNPDQPEAVALLRAAGHEVYDFRNPPSGSPGFAWSPIDPDWLSWSPEKFVAELQNPIARQGFRFDKEGLDWCEACVLLLPCGRSAHLEAGYAIGQGKPTLIVLSEDKFEPELMYLLADRVVPGLSHMIEAVRGLGGGKC
jgi:DNA-binding XRE family transcriptional regulator